MVDFSLNVKSFTKEEIKVTVDNLKIFRLYIENIVINDKGNNVNTATTVNVFIVRAKWEPSSMRLWVWRGRSAWPSGS